MIIEYLAALVYGVLAMVAALALSSQADSPIATALVFAAAGLAYLFQVFQIGTGQTPQWLLYLVIGALLASVTVSIWSTF